MTIVLVLHDPEKVDSFTWPYGKTNSALRGAMEEDQEAWGAIMGNIEKMIM